MDWIGQVAFAVVVAAIFVSHAFSERHRSSAITNLLRSFTEQQKSSSDSHRELMTTLIQQTETHHEAMASLSNSNTVVNHLRENGVSAYLVDPSARVEDEILAVMNHLGIDREHAKKYLQQQLSSE